MSGSGEAAAAAINLSLPAIQAAATLVILDKQKDYHDDVANKRIGLIDAAVTKYCDAIEACIATNIFDEAFGSVPVAVEYVPVDAYEEQFQTIQDNLRNVPAADRLSAATDMLNRNNDIARMVAFCPAFMEHAHVACIQIKDLMAGKLPIDSAVNVLTDVAEQAALNGRIGNTCKITARSLGIERLKMQALGRRELAAQADLAQKVNPVQKQFTIQEMFNTPQNRIGLALTQNQLIQQSLQNVANADAAGDPAKYGELQAKLQKINNALGAEAQRGNLVNAFVPNYAAILQPQVNSIIDALHGGIAQAPQTPDKGTPKTTGNGSGGAGFSSVTQNSVGGSIDQ